MAGKSSAVTRVTLQGKCIHNLDLVSCVDCRTAAMRKIRSPANRPDYADLVEGVGDLRELIRTAIPYVAARAVLDEPDRGFWLDEVVGEVATVRSLKEFTVAMFGKVNPYFLQQAEQYMTTQVRNAIKVRDAETSVRLYVCWRIRGFRKRRWGALHHLHSEQLELVARDYGILGDGVRFSKDAALYLADLLHARGEQYAVADIWDQAIPQLVEWKQAG